MGHGAISFTERARELTQGADGYLAWAERSIEVSMDPRRLAVVVCDMWDNHWSRAARERGAVLASRIDSFLARARTAGISVVHAPSETMGFYAAAPARKRILGVTQVPLPAQREHADPQLPVDDSDGGSDTNTGTETTDAAVWTRQTDLIRIDEARDCISDSGAEIYSWMRAKGIETVLLCGVHTNMCILDRSFGIKSFVSRGIPVVLLRDLTDSLYNPARSPYVSHDEGTGLIVGYIERFWCPTATSTDITHAIETMEKRS